MSLHLLCSSLHKTIKIMLRRSFFKGGQIIAIAMVLSVIAFPACNNDDDPIPTTAKITGVVTFDNIELWSTWADSGEVQFTLFPEFSLDPPSGWGETANGTIPIGAPSVTFTIDLDTTRTEYGFEVMLSDMTGSVEFSAMAVGFRHDLVSDPSKRTATLGVHWDTPDEVSHGIQILPFFDYPAPSVFTVEPGDELEINFKADLSFVQIWPFR